MKVVLSALYLILTSLGLTFMKIGGESIVLDFKDGISFKIGFLTLIGFLCYMFSFLLWQKLLVSYELSYIFPILTGIVQIIVLLIAIFVFKEPVNFYNIVGIIFIIIGVALVSHRIAK